MKPILKWAGGKRKLIPAIEPYICDAEIYVEPFVGGGALVFNKKPKRAIINDLNKNLINVYRTVRDEPDNVIYYLKILQEQTTKLDYYRIRYEERLDEFRETCNAYRAARTIYLNKTCYNGLYRVNKKGYFNVPYGNRQGVKLFDEQNLREISDYLSKNDVDIQCTDYRNILLEIHDNSFVYLDPPYMNTYNNYTEYRFDQAELKEQCDILDCRNIRFLQSNIDIPEIRELYKDYKIINVDTIHSMNRNKVKEVLITNGY